MKLMRVILALTATVILAACGDTQATVAPSPTVSSAQTSSAAGPSNFDAIMAKAPFAYTGMCKVEKRDGRWWQMGHDITDLPAPTPCSNLWASIGTFSDGQHYNFTQAADSNAITTTDRIWIKAEPQSSGDRLITWGVKSGVQIEWIFAFSGHILPAGTGSYLWHPSEHMTYPTFSVYGNDTTATTGRYVGITGPPAPMP